MSLSTGSATIAASLCLESGGEGALGALGGLAPELGLPPESGLPDFTGKCWN